MNVPEQTALDDVPITTREDLIFLLGEAAEVEHNLMCTYLYAIFGLKRSVDEGLSEEELAAVTAWRASIMGVAIEEMTHLALVANLTCAIGSRPNFDRPNFPVAPGHHPADLVVRLAPFDLDTLDHFIFLERPDNLPVQDSPAFRAPTSYERGTAVPDAVMPSDHDYPTVGALYAALRRGVKALSDSIGEQALFTGSADTQVGPAEAALPGLVIVTDLDSALLALDTIVEQGEGASVDGEVSHFVRFRRVRERYEALLHANPNFTPSRPIANNPVMRRPADPTGRVYIDEPDAAALVDLCNAIYAEMVRALTQAFGRSDRDPGARKLMIDLAVDLMHAVMPAAEALTRMPASAGLPGVNAGMTFATLKTVMPGVEGPGEWAVIVERVEELATRAQALCTGERAALDAVPLKLMAAARPIRARARRYRATAASAAGSPDEDPAPSAVAVLERRAGAETTGQDVRYVEGRGIAIGFDATRCIHSRFCVLRQPHVYRAAVEGEWIDPDADSPEELMSLARQCPSGAITYRTVDGAPEPAPRVNTVGPREDGPLAFRGDLRLDGVPIGRRATLCRCGASGNKPFCDGSHLDAQFKASGEAPSRPDEGLEARDGPLDIVPQRNGPLRIDGNLDVVSGTQRALMRTRQVRLCRCGHSGTKPFCDGTHAAVGFVSDDSHPVSSPISLPGLSP